MTSRWTLRPNPRNAMSPRSSRNKLIRALHHPRTPTQLPSQRTFGHQCPVSQAHHRERRLHNLVSLPSNNRALLFLPRWRIRDKFLRQNISRERCRAHHYGRQRLGSNDRLVSLYTRVGWNFRRPHSSILRRQAGLTLGRPGHLLYRLSTLRRCMDRELCRLLLGKRSRLRLFMGLYTPDHLLDNPRCLQLGCTLEG